MSLTWLNVVPLQESCQSRGCIRQHRKPTNTGKKVLHGQRFQNVLLRATLLISNPPYQMKGMCLVQARRTLVFYLQAEVKGAQSSSPSPESPLSTVQKSIFSLGDPFAFPPQLQTKSQAGLELHRGETTSVQDSLSHLCRPFQTTDWDAHEYGWIDVETEAGSVALACAGPVGSVRQFPGTGFYAAARTPEACGMGKALLP